MKKKKKMTSRENKRSCVNRPDDTGIFDTRGVFRTQSYICNGVFLRK